MRKKRKLFCTIMYEDFKVVNEPQQYKVTVYPEESIEITARYLTKADSHKLSGIMDCLQDIDNCVVSFYSEHKDRVAITNNKDKKTTTFEKLTNKMLTKISYIINHLNIPVYYE